MVILLVFTQPAGAPVLDWVGQFHGPQIDWAFDTKVDATGNVYTVGPFRGTVDSKLDSAGNFVWAKHSVMLPSNQ